MPSYSIYNNPLYLHTRAENSVSLMPSCRGTLMVKYFPLPQPTSSTLPVPAGNGSLYV